MGANAEISDAEIIRKYSDMVYRMAFSLVKRKADAEDIYQEVFFKYLKKHPVFQNAEHEKAWFLRVTMNCCKNYWKTPWLARMTELKEAETERGTVADGADTEDAESARLIEQVKQLPEKYRVVIHLFYYEELSVEEISRILKRKPSTVRTQLTRARALLRERLQEE